MLGYFSASGTLSDEHGIEDADRPKAATFAEVHSQLSKQIHEEVQEELRTVLTKVGENISDEVRKLREHFQGEVDVWKEANNKLVEKHNSLDSKSMTAMEKITEKVGTLQQQLESNTSLSATHREDIGRELGVCHEAVERSREECFSHVTEQLAAYPHSLQDDSGVGDMGRQRADLIEELSAWKDDLADEVRTRQSQDGIHANDIARLRDEMQKSLETWKDESLSTHHEHVLDMAKVTKQISEESIARQDQLELLAADSLRQSDDMLREAKAWKEARAEYAAELSSIILQISDETQAREQAEEVLAADLGTHREDMDGKLCVLHEAFEQHREEHQEQLSKCHMAVERTQLECVALVMDQQVGDSSNTDFKHADSVRDSSKESVRAQKEPKSNMLPFAGKTLLEEKAAVNSQSFQEDGFVADTESEQLRLAIAEEVKTRERQVASLSQQIASHTLQIDRQVARLTEVSKQSVANKTPNRGCW